MLADFLRNLAGVAVVSLGVVALLWGAGGFASWVEDRRTDRAALSPQMLDDLRAIARRRFDDLHGRGA